MEWRCLRPQWSQGEWLKAAPRHLHQGRQEDCCKVTGIDWPLKEYESSRNPTGIGIVIAYPLPWGSSPGASGVLHPRRDGGLPEFACHYADWETERIAEPDFWSSWNGSAAEQQKHEARNNHVNSFLEFNLTTNSAFWGWFNMKRPFFVCFQAKVLTFFGTWKLLSRKIFEKYLHTYIFLVTCYFILC